MFGSHLSIAGSMSNALREAEKLGLDCVQVFTKNQQQWTAPPLKDEAVAEWAWELKRMAWGAEKVVSHASYLANLASPNDELWEKSVGLMREELERCERLGIRHLVFHPGAFTTSSLEEGMAKIAKACSRLVKETKGYATVLCLENVAGAGSTVGRRFEELADIRQRTVEATGQPDRVGYCIDTCHMHAAGYDLGSEKSARAAVDELVAVLGADIRCMHLNDSKGKAGSHLDRHEHIGQGTIGEAGFAVVVNQPGLRGVPKVMETPKGAGPRGQEWDSINVALLRKLCASEKETGGKRRSVRR
ncbi:MAG: deoxyribonuclease IV [Phycisphaerales bacterium]